MKTAHPLCGGLRAQNGSGLGSHVLRRQKVSVTLGKRTAIVFLWLTFKSTLKREEDYLGERICL